SMEPGVTTQLARPNCFCGFVATSVYPSPVSAPRSQPPPDSSSPFAFQGDGSSTPPQFYQEHQYQHIPAPFAKSRRHASQPNAWDSKSRVFKTNWVYECHYAPRQRGMAGSENSGNCMGCKFEKKLAMYRERDNGLEHFKKQAVEKRNARIDQHQSDAYQDHSSAASQHQSSGKHADYYSPTNSQTAQTTQPQRPPGYHTNYSQDREAREDSVRNRPSIQGNWEASSSRTTYPRVETPPFWKPQPSYSSTAGLGPCSTSTNRTASSSAPDYRYSGEAGASQSPAFAKTKVCGFHMHALEWHIIQALPSKPSSLSTKLAIARRANCPVFNLSITCWLDSGPNDLILRPYNDVYCFCREPMAISTELSMLQNQHERIDFVCANRSPFLPKPQDSDIPPIPAEQPQSRSSERKSKAASTNSSDSLKKSSGKDVAYDLVVSAQGQSCSQVLGLSTNFRYRPRVEPIHRSLESDPWLDQWIRPEHPNTSYYQPLLANTKKLETTNTHSSSTNNASQPRLTATKIDSNSIPSILNKKSLRYPIDYSSESKWNAAPGKRTMFRKEVLVGIVPQPEYRSQNSSPSDPSRSTGRSWNTNGHTFDGNRAVPNDTVSQKQEKGKSHLKDESLALKLLYSGEPLWHSAEDSWNDLALPGPSARQDSRSWLEVDIPQSHCMGWMVDFGIYGLDDLESLSTGSEDEESAQNHDHHSGPSSPHPHKPHHHRRPPSQSQSSLAYFAVKEAIQHANSTLFRASDHQQELLCSSERLLADRLNELEKLETRHASLVERINIMKKYSDRERWQPGTDQDADSEPTSGPSPTTVASTPPRPISPRSEFERLIEEGVIVPQSINYGGSTNNSTNRPSNPDTATGERLAFNGSQMSTNGRSAHAYSATPSRQNGSLAGIDTSSEDEGTSGCNSPRTSESKLAPMRQEPASIQSEPASPEFKAMNRGKCRVCYENNMTHALVPCFHLVLCEECANILNDCIVCRRPKER
ncbi:hypothetical protein BGW38_005300, partial [Lunasporangiospora selenospora]